MFWPLIFNTYQDLFDKMGGQDILPEALAKLAQAEDPFTIPDQPGVDLGGLQRKMREFKEMLESAGWNTPEVRGLLRAGLQSRAGQNEVPTQKIETAVNKTRAEEKVIWPFPGTPVYSPQGDKILLTFPTPMGQSPPSSKAAIYDVAAKTLQQGTTTIGSFREGTFTPDGKSLVFGDVGSVIQVVPLDAKGNPRFDQAKQIGTKISGNTESGWKIVSLTSGLSPNRFYGHADHGGAYMRPYLFNFATGERLRVKIEAHLLAGNLDSSFATLLISDWGRLPGSENLYFLVREAGGVRRHVVSVDDTGKVTPVEKDIFWSLSDPALAGFPTERLQFSADGKTAVGWSAGVVSYVPAGSTSAKAFDLKLIPQESIAAVLTHPKKNEVLALIVNRAVPPEKGYRLEVFDLGNGQHRGSIPVKHLIETPRLSFSPDGNFLLMTSQLTSTALNYESRLVPTP